MRAVPVPWYVGGSGFGCAARCKKLQIDPMRFLPIHCSGVATIYNSGVATPGDRCDKILAYQYCGGMKNIETQLFIVLGLTSLLVLSRLIIHHTSLISNLCNNFDFLDFLRPRCAQNLHASSKSNPPLT